MTIDPSKFLAAIPVGLRDPLLETYREIASNFAEHRWEPSELNGGKFCECVYWVCQGFVTGTYVAAPSKPANMRNASRAIEELPNSGKSGAHSLRILIPRMLPALYDIRNNRGVGHVGGDVDPNLMDATAVYSMASWILAELVRVFHNVKTSLLVNVPRLVTAYFAGQPDPKIPSQRVAFGTSGHRGSAFNDAFNEAHILAISQALCDHRRHNGIDGPLFIGIDTHALAECAMASALEVFAANDVTVMIDERDGYTPTPVISHAILTTNKNRTSGLADGVVITPSHNPPEDGGFKYNPPNGGPADTDITTAIERAANAFLEDDLRGVKRISYERARKAACVHRYDYIGPYVADLANVVDMEAIRGSGVKIGIDPLGGAAVHFWQPIIERYGIAATIVSDTVDPTFRFMTADWDGKIRMDCSSPYAMARLIGMRDEFDVAFANDTDADRHGIVPAPAA